MELWSAGHSNRSAAELVALLAGAGIACVADVRRFPVSRRFPQHSRVPLEKALAAAGIGYAFLGDALGTPELEAGLERLGALARARPTALLCAERDWRDCHRRILCDAVAARGWSVVHLVRPGESEPHRLDPRARLEAGRVCYPTLL